jgi:hypothetical protein
MYMSRLSKYLLVFVLLVFVLACNFVTQPIRDVQEGIQTVESIATAIPIQTLQAFPSMVPTLEGIASAIPEFDNYFDPQGTPASDWQGVPIMPQATAGQEFDNNTYSFRTDAAPQEVVDYYNDQLVKLGWSQTFNLPIDDNGGIAVFSKDNNLLTITITSLEGSTTVILALV